MLRLSKKMLFAIEAVLDIAFHAGPEPVPKQRSRFGLRLPFSERSHHWGRWHPDRR